MLIELFEKKYYQDYSAQNRFIAIYNNKDEPTQFECGFVFFTDENFVGIFSISPSGEPNGLRIICNKQIFRIDLDNSYLKDLTQKYAELGCPSSDLSETFKIIENDILKSVFEFSMSSKRLLTVQLHNSDYDFIEGFVDEYGDDYCILHSGENDTDDYSHTIFQTEAITYISIK